MRPQESPPPLPAVIGGPPDARDIIPTSIVILAYTLLLPVALYRILNPTSRNVLQIPLLLFVIERISSFCLRLAQAAGRWGDPSYSLVEWLEISLACGWLVLAHDILPFLQCLMINSTKFPETGSHLPHLLLRRRIRRFNWILATLLTIVHCWSLASGLFYKHAAQSRDSDDITVVSLCRYLSVSMGIVIILIAISVVVWSERNLKHFDAKAGRFLVKLWLICLVVPVYRLCVFHLTTNSISSRHTSSQLPDEVQKVIFYVFHIVPEWLIAAVVLCMDTRKSFDTGIWGDYGESRRWRFWLLQAFGICPIKQDQHHGTSEGAGHVGKLISVDVEKGCLPDDADSYSTPVTTPSGGQSQLSLAKHVKVDGLPFGASDQNACPLPKSTRRLRHPTMPTFFDSPNKAKLSPRLSVLQQEQETSPSLIPIVRTQLASATASISLAPALHFATQRPTSHIDTHNVEWDRPTSPQPLIFSETPILIPPSFHQTPSSESNLIREYRAFRWFHRAPTPSSVL